MHHLQVCIHKLVFLWQLYFCICLHILNLFIATFRCWILAAYNMPRLLVFKATVHVIMTLIRMRSLHSRPPTLSLEQLQNNPYILKQMRKVIDCGAFKIYGHWVKKGDNQNRAALFENAIKRDIKLNVTRWHHHHFSRSRTLNHDLLRLHFSSCGFLSPGHCFSPLCSTDFVSFSLKFWVRWVCFVFCEKKVSAISLSTFSEVCQ